MKSHTLVYISSLSLALAGSCDLYPYSSEGAMTDGGATTGTGGSMARFALAGDYLYAVDNTTLKTFDLTAPETPAYLPGKDQYLDFGVETIFPMDTLLFLGSQTGMYVFNITRPEFPQQLALVPHIASCDPVVASGSYAYVTLNSQNTWCGRSTNELHIYDLADIYNPKLVYRENSFRNPKGLGIDGKKLFVCDNGLKVFDVSNPLRPIWIDDITDIPEIGETESYDVIPQGGILLLVGAGGLYQLDYTGEKLSFVSKITVSPK